MRCERCPRLVRHRADVAARKRRAYRDWQYWGQPVPSFGDPHARLLLVGLAPGAHGANRTGRVFTGDASGDFLFDALHETGFASQRGATSRDDGLTLTDCYITSAVRCAPPGNRPRPREFSNCRDYLDREISLLPRVRAILALGQLAHNAYLNVLRSRRGPFPQEGRVLRARRRVQAAGLRSDAAVQLPSQPPEHADRQAHETHDDRRAASCKGARRASLGAVMRSRTEKMKIFSKVQPLAGGFHLYLSGQGHRTE